MSSRRPWRRLASSCAAPVRPVSSSIVNSNSSGPWIRSVASMIASMVATPIPLSEPRVVPDAVRYSPSRRGLIVSWVKSWSTSEFFSLTMSRCDWRIVAGEFSRPAVPGLRTTTFPAASTTADSPHPSATVITCCRIRSSLLEPRGIVRMVSKCCQRAVGSSVATNVMDSPDHRYYQPVPSRTFRQRAVSFAR